MSITPLEKRTTGIELALEQTVSFGEAILAVLKEILERTNVLERAVEQNAAFNVSVPDILREISERVYLLESALKEDANFNHSAESAFNEFSERINTLNQSIPAILKEAAAHTGIPERLVPSVAAAAPDVLKDVMQRLSVAEAAISRISASGQKTPLNSSAIDALKDSLRNVVERMGLIESIALRLSTPEPRTDLSPDVLNPLQDALKRVAERVTVLEARAERPSAVNLDATPNSSISDALKKLAARVDILESSSGGFTIGNTDSVNSEQIQLLAQASQLYHKNWTVVFVGSENFSDNIKYAYLAFLTFIAGTNTVASFLCSTRRQYEQLSGARLPCISPFPADWSSQDARTLISAKVVVLDDILHSRSGKNAMAHALLKGAKVIQLWHGIPFKEIGLQNLFSTREGKDFRADALASCGPFDVLVASAATARREWERWFSFKEFAPIGVPRTDIFFQNLSMNDRINVDEKTLAIVQAASSENKRVVLYAPTFRDHNPSWFETIDLDAFATHCRERGWLLFVNLHPREQGAVNELRVKYPNVSFVEPDTDIFPIAKYSDCLVTDYSSLAFDFLYCDRPVVFYRPDHADYVARACTLVQKNENLIAGPVTLTVESLIAAVANVFDRPDMEMFRETRAILRKKLFDYQDGKSAGRFCALVQRYLEPGVRFVPVAT